jgi:predicted DNA-binding transcriptional regulator AlpA
MNAQYNSLQAVLVKTERSHVEHWDEKYLAQALAVSLSTVRRWRATGAGPKFSRFGRSVRYRLADIEEWITAKTEPESKTMG